MFSKQADHFTNDYIDTKAVLWKQWFKIFRAWNNFFLQFLKCFRKHIDQST